MTTTTDTANHMTDTELTALGEKTAKEIATWEPARRDGFLQGMAVHAPHVYHATTVALATIWQAQAATVATPAEPEPVKIKITIASTSSGNDPEAHKAGCADVQRGLKSGKYQSAYTIDATGPDDVVRSFWDCIWQEHADNHGMTEAETIAAFRDSYTRYLPCTGW
jgi:hypothetical protein